MRYAGRATLLARVLCVAYSAGEKSPDMMRQRRYEVRIDLQASLTRLPGLPIFNGFLNRDFRRDTGRG